MATRRSDDERVKRECNHDTHMLGWCGYYELHANSSTETVELCLHMLCCVCVCVSAGLVLLSVISDDDDDDACHFSNKDQY